MSKFLSVFVFLALFYPTANASHLTLKSPAFFSNNSNINSSSKNILIPKLYTCEGRNISPPLYWQNPPKKTKSFVLIVDDIDAPNDWVHWLVFNIPAKVGLLPEAAQLPKGALSGKNSWQQNGYRGPCPPTGKHHYFFRLFALDTTLKLDSNVEKLEVIKAMKGHVLETSELIGIYSREKP